jgi:hypothetical protein
MDRVKAAVVPFGGRHEIVEHTSKFGFTFGIEGVRAIGRGLSIVMPVRVTRLGGELPAHWQHGFDVQAGVGISMRVLRRVE